MKVWAVSEGEYSDFKVIAVFATKELADEFHLAYYGEPDSEKWPNIMEWDVHASLPPVIEWWCGTVYNNMSPLDEPTIQRRASAPSLFPAEEWMRQPPEKLETNAYTPSYDGGIKSFSAKGPERDDVARALGTWLEANHR